MAFLPITTASVGRRRRSFVNHKVSDSNISRTISPRITKFYTDIHTNLLNSHNGYGVSSYFQSAFIEVRKETAEHASSVRFE